MSKALLKLSVAITIACTTGCATVPPVKPATVRHFASQPTIPEGQPYVDHVDTRHRNPVHDAPAQSYATAERNHGETVKGQ